MQARRDPKYLSMPASMEGAAVAIPACVMKASWVSIRGPLTPARIVSKHDCRGLLSSLQPGQSLAGLTQHSRALCEMEANKPAFRMRKEA